MNRISRSNPSLLVARKLEQNRWKPPLLGITKEPSSAPAEFLFSIRALTCELSKSLSPFAAVGVAELNGNGTLLVSWFTYTSTRPLPRVRREIPSGMDSNRKPLSPNTSPTVRSGVISTPSLTPMSIEGRPVLNPPLLAASEVVAVAVRATARNVLTMIFRLCMLPPS